MANLTDIPAFTANEIYELDASDPVEGAALGASFGGIGKDNQPHQQLANRTAFLKGRQDTNIANIATLLAFMAGFTGSLTQNGYVKIPLPTGTLIIQWGFYPLPNTKIGNDTQYSLSFPIPFPNAILVPPIATNVYVATGGANTAASVVAYSKTGATFVLDVPGILITTGQAGKETTNGLSWLAIGF